MSNWIHTFTGGPPSALPNLVHVSRSTSDAAWVSEPHHHPYAEIFFIMEAGGYFLIQNETLRVSVGDIVFIDSGVTHTERALDGERLSYFVIGVQNLPLSLGNKGYSLLAHQGASNPFPSYIDLISHTVMQERGRQGQGSALLVQALLLELDNLRSNLRTVGGPSSGVTFNCQLVRRYLDEHFKENIRLDQLAEIFHISKYHLSHAFQREFNISPQQYCLNRRVEESCFLLTQTNHSIAVIAETLGFSSQSHFSQVFRRREGLSPLQYRHLHKPRQRINLETYSPKRLRRRRKSSPAEPEA